MVFQTRVLETEPAGSALTMSVSVGDARRQVLEIADGLFTLGRQTTATAINIGWITHDMREVADNSQSIGAAVTQLSASIAEISRTSDSGAEHAQAVGSAVQESRSEISRNSQTMVAIAEQVGAVASRVRELESAVEHISDMVLTIDSISKQTNLLALNATIEAARAGEAGRGFAVVAAEVKSLSASAAKATDEISNRIDALMMGMDSIRSVTDQSVKEVEAGDQRARSVMEKFDSLACRIDAIAGAIQAVSDQLGQQTIASEEISRNITTISEKAGKVRQEIESSLEVFQKSEGSLKNVIDRCAAAGAPSPELLTECAALIPWKRKLAATLVGAIPAVEETAECSKRALRGYLERSGDQVLKEMPEWSALKSADDKAHNAASRMITSIKAQDWERAIPAYNEADKAICEALDKCQSILTRLSRD